MGMCILLDSHVICNDYITPPPPKPNGVRLYCHCSCAAVVREIEIYLSHTAVGSLHLGCGVCVCKEEALLLEL